MQPTTTPESVGLSSERLERIRPWMQGYVDAGKLPGASVLVARAGEIAWVAATGFADVEQRRPFGTDHLLRFYSMTKPVTSVAAMMLYEQGLFQLDDPVARFLPALGDMQVFVSGEGDDMKCEPARRPITIQQLLTHSAGFTYGLDNDHPVSRLYRDRRTDFYPTDGPLEEVISRLAGLPLVHHPGERWNYGVATDVLGRLVEVVSGQRLDRFFAEHILGPLGMHDTAFRVPPDKRDRLARLYGPSKDGGLNLLEPSEVSPYFDSVTTFAGGAGLISTLGDYFRFTEMLRRGGALDGVRLLGRKTVQYMTCNHLPGDLAEMGQDTFTETNYAGIGFGLGFAVVQEPTRAAVLTSVGEYHWGGAASTVFWIDPVEDLTVIFLTQLLPSSTYPLRRELRALVYPALID